MVKKWFCIQIFISLFVIFFTPQSINAKIKIEVDSVTGETKIASRIADPKDPLEGVIFTFLDSKCWLKLYKTEDNCWLFENQVEVLLEYEGEWRIHQNRAYSKNQTMAINHTCTIEALFNFDSTLADISKAENVILISRFRNKDSIIVWDLSREMLNEWKLVVRFNNSKNLDSLSSHIETTTARIFDTSGFKMVETDSISDIELPQLIEAEKVKYPENARQNGIEGGVVVAALVDKMGKARLAKIVKNSGINAGFEEEALEAAYKTTYKPAFQNGKPVAVWIYYPVYFRLR